MRCKRRFQAEVYKIDSSGAKSPQSELGYIAPDSLFSVRPARTYPKGCKSLNRPDSGKVTAKGKGVRRETESGGSRRQTSGLTDRNPIKGLRVRIRLQKKSKSDNYPKSPKVNRADIRWKEYVHNWRGLAGERKRAVTTNCEKSAEGHSTCLISTRREGPNFI